MKQVKSLTSISPETNFIAGIDMTGNIKKLFENPAQMPGCLFLLCLRGRCNITIHLNKYEFKKNFIAVIYPDQFVQITDPTNECRFAFVGFSSTLIQHPFLFSNTIQYAPAILEEPITELDPKTGEVFRDYFKVLIKAQHLNNTFVREEQLPLILTGLIIELGNIKKQEPVATTSQRYTRSQEIVKELIRIVIENYKTERNISFYADKMHLSPQHLSTTIKKTTGRTLTDIISAFVIKDAQAKLKSTELTIQEIAYSLNFPDISFFGKYFKRYTGMSPKQYRNLE